MVERADIANVLMQMKAIRAQMDAAPVTPVIRSDAAAVAPDKVQFGSLLKSAVDRVNEAQASSKAMAIAYEKGDPTVDLPEVMIGLQKASVSFQAMLQVRNRLVTAYEDIIKMPM